tara:strand:- start:2282 stop:2431 length:150 start_codon:yes stop_codon:yes gene_type:complete
MSKTVEIMVDRQKYAQMLMTIIKMPMDAFLEPALRDYAEDEILRLIGEQ